MTTGSDAEAFSRTGSGRKSHGHFLGIGDDRGSRSWFGLTTVEGDLVQIQIFLKLTLTPLQTTCADLILKKKIIELYVLSQAQFNVNKGTLVLFQHDAFQRLNFSGET